MFGKSRMRGGLVTGFSFALAAALALCIWTIVKGHVPSVSHFEFWVWKVNLAFAISRWWDVPAAFVWGIVVYHLLIVKEPFPKDGFLFKLHYEMSELNTGMVLGWMAALIANFALILPLFTRIESILPSGYFWAYGLVNLSLLCMVSLFSAIAMAFENRRFNLIGSAIEGGFGAFVAYALVMCMAYGLLKSLLIGLAIPLLLALCILAAYSFVLWIIYGGADEPEHV